MAGGQAHSTYQRFSRDNLARRSVFGGERIARAGNGRLSSTSGKERARSSNRHLSGLIVRRGGAPLPSDLLHKSSRKDVRILSFVQPDERYSRSSRISRRSGLAEMDRRRSVTSPPDDPRSYEEPGTIFGPSSRNMIDSRLDCRQKRSGAREAALFDSSRHNAELTAAASFR